MRIEDQTKVLVMARYLSIIESVVKSCSRITLVKLLVISFLFMNHEQYIKEYKGRTKKNLFELFVSLFQNDLKKILKDFPYMIDCILLLKENRLIDVNGSLIENLNCISLEDEKQLSILASSMENISDEQVLREVLNYA